MKILHCWLSLGTYIMPDFSYHTLNSFWQLILGSIINEKTALKSWQHWCESKTNHNGVLWELFQD